MIIRFFFVNWKLFIGFWLKCRCWKNKAFCQNWDCFRSISVLELATCSNSLVHEFAQHHKWNLEFPIVKWTYSAVIMLLIQILRCEMPDELRILYRRPYLCCYIHLFQSDFLKDLLERRDRNRVEAAFTCFPPRILRLLTFFFSQEFVIVIFGHFHSFWSVKCRAPPKHR